MSMGGNPFDIIGYDVIDEVGKTLASGVNKVAAESVRDAHGGTIVPVLRMFAHRSAYVVHPTSD